MTKLGSVTNRSDVTSLEGAELPPANRGSLGGGKPITFSSGNDPPSGEATSLLQAPSMSPDDAIALLQGIFAGLSNENAKSATAALQGKGDQAKQMSEQRLQKLKEAAEAIEKAKNSGVLAKIFGWIGVAFAAIAAVAVTVATLGSAAGATVPAIAGAVAAMAGATLAMTQQIVSSIPGAMEGMGPEGAKAFMGVMMAAQILAAAASLGAGVWGSLSSAGAKGVALGADVGNAATRIERMGMMVKNAAQIGAGVNEVAQGANIIKGAGDTRDADRAKADAAEIAKWLKQIQNQKDSEIDFIRDLTELQDKGWEIVASIVRTAGEANQAVNRIGKA